MRLITGQPAQEITPRSGADRRDWIIGTPDDAIAQIERMQTETGGFGGLMLTTHEWASTEKLRHSYELFARYVMPHFRGHTQGYRDEWQRIQQATSDRRHKSLTPISRAICRVKLARGHERRGGSMPFNTRKSTGGN